MKIRERIAPEGPLNINYIRRLRSFPTLKIKEPKSWLFQLLLLGCPPGIILVNGLIISP